MKEKSDFRKQNRGNFERHTELVIMDIGVWRRPSETTQDK